VELIPFLNLTKVYNTGFLFGLGREWNSTGKLFFYLVIPTAVLFIFAYLWFKTEDRLQRFALSLIIGGSLGNLTDRLVRGKVPDFIDLHAFGWHYPAFNVADICITVGVIFLLISILKPLRGN
jgi:signal peptidase II